MKHIPDIRALLRHMNKASDFMRWLRAEGDSLVASADLLGGRKWAARARAVVEAAKAGNDLAARRGELHELTVALDEASSARAAAYVNLEVVARIAVAAGTPEEGAGQ